MLLQRRRVCGRSVHMLCMLCECMGRTTVSVRSVGWRAAVRAATGLRQRALLGTRCRGLAQQGSRRWRSASDSSTVDSGKM